MTSYISDVQWKHYREEGYAQIGRVATGEELRALQNRIDDIMLGEAPLDYDRMLMQLDREPGAEGPGPQTNGHKGATLSYRKIQSLEFRSALPFIHAETGIPRGVREGLR